MRYGDGGSSIDVDSDRCSDDFDRLSLNREFSLLESSPPLFLLPRYSTYVLVDPSLILNPDSSLLPYLYDAAASTFIASFSFLSITANLLLFIFSCRFKYEIAPVYCDITYFVADWWLIEYIYFTTCSITR